MLYVEWVKLGLVFLILICRKGEINDEVYLCFLEWVLEVFLGSC